MCLIIVALMERVHLEVWTGNNRMARVVKDEGYLR